MSQEVFLFQEHPTGLSVHVMHSLLLVEFGYLNVIDSLGLSFVYPRSEKETHHTNVFTGVEFLPRFKQKAEWAMHSFLVTEVPRQREYVLRLF